jgi:hypothetical protein
MTDDAEAQMNTKWQGGSGQQQYTLTVGDYQALVWYQTTGDWSALISRDNVAVNNNTFNTLKDAQIWCETHLTELQAKP